MDLERMVECHNKAASTFLGLYSEGDLKATLASSFSGLLGCLSGVCFQLALHRQLLDTGS